jgi:hypothetical protein
MSSIIAKLALNSKHHQNIINQIIISGRYERVYFVKLIEIVMAVACLKTLFLRGSYQSPSSPARSNKYKPATREIRN